MAGVCNWWMPTGSRPSSRARRSASPMLSTETTDRAPAMGPITEGEAHLIGAKASCILKAPGFNGRVIAAGSKAAYISGADGSILAICQPDQQPHPRAVLSTLDPSQLEEGAGVWVDGRRMRFDNGVALELKCAEVWSRRPTEPGRGFHLAEVARRSRQVLLAAMAVHHGDNLGLALPIIDVPSSRAGGSSSIVAGSPLLAAAIEPIQLAVRHCRRGRFDLALDTLQPLLGLGPGLTPSGDDFTGGLLFAAWHLDHAHPSMCQWSGARVHRLVGRARSLTNRISHALLSDLAVGCGFEALHDLVDGLLTGPGPLDPSFEPPVHVRRVTSIGGSSGWDMLAGVLTGMLLAGNPDYAQRVA